MHHKKLNKPLHDFVRLLLLRAVSKSLSAHVNCYHYVT